jgi:hypothetical protein
VRTWAELDRFNLSGALYLLDSDGREYALLRDGSLRQSLQHQQEDKAWTEYTCVLGKPLNGHVRVLTVENATFDGGIGWTVNKLVSLGCKSSNGGSGNDGRCFNFNQTLRQLLCELRAGAVVFHIGTTPDGHVLCVYYYSPKDVPALQRLLAEADAEAAQRALAKLLPLKGTMSAEEYKKREEEARRTKSQLAFNPVMDPMREERSPFKLFVASKRKQLTAVLDGGAVVYDPLLVQAAREAEASAIVEAHSHASQARRPFLSLVFCTPFPLFAFPCALPPFPCCAQRPRLMQPTPPSAACTCPLAAQQPVLHARGAQQPGVRLAHRGARGHEPVAVLPQLLAAAAGRGARGALQHAHRRRAVAAGLAHEGAHHARLQGVRPWPRSPLYPQDPRPERHGRVRAG